MTDLISSPLQQLISRQFQVCADAFAQANLLVEWQTLQQTITPQLTQLIISSDYAMKTICQFPYTFWQMFEQGELTQAHPRPYYHQQLTQRLANKTTDRKSVV